MEASRRKFIFAFCFSCCLLIMLFTYIIPEVGIVKFSWFRQNNFSLFLMPQKESDLSCKMPELDPFHSTIKHLYKQLKVPYQCGKKPSFLIIKANATVLIDEKRLWKYHEVKSRNISCTYVKIWRNPGTKKKPTDNKITLDKAKHLDFGVPLGIEFALVECLNTSQKFHEEYLALTPLKADVEKKCENSQKNTEINDKLNVVIIGIDSISRLNFIRHFPKTRKFLREEMKTFEMKRYNKVADNTFPNLTPLLTGHFVEFYGTGNFFDNIDLIWKHYSDIGYRTMLAEDAPNMTTYNYLKEGFKKPPADYYLRPFTLAIEKSPLRKKSKPHCFGDRMEMKVMFDNVRTFVDTMNDRPYFLFTFVARLTHDVLNNAAYVPYHEHAHEILQYLHETGVTNNSLVIFMSDHGIRFGPIRQTYIGMFEERWPIMHFSLPNWFLGKYPDVERNLRINQERLTTPFDVHATLMDVLNLVSNSSHVTGNSDKNGTSLFVEIPKGRSCEDASILPHWCTCQRQVQTSVKNKNVRKAADSLIDAINRMLKEDLSGCATISLKTIKDAYVSSPKNSTPESNILDYLLKISVEPSDAIFESTVRFSHSKYEVQGDISRINHYGSQGDCTTDSKLRKYCYCK